MDFVNGQPKEPCGLGFEQLNKLADSDLIAHLTAGHNDALAVLFDRYHRLILSVAFKILRDPAEAEDVMQSVFLEIYRVAGQFEASRGSAKVWLLQYAYHRSINRREYLKLRGFYAGDQQEHRQSKPAESPARATASQMLTLPEARCMVREAMESLNHSIINSSWPVRPEFRRRNTGRSLSTWNNALLVILLTRISCLLLNNRPQRNSTA